MREKQCNQMPILIPSIDHPRAEELQRISDILDKNPIISEMVWQDLTREIHTDSAGAHGMSAEQVLRAAIVKQTEGFSYEDLAFHIVDSRCYRHFCRIGFADEGFKKSALCAAIKSISPQTWKAINDILMAYAQDQGMEKGQQSRVDCTVVSSNIHEPSDSTLLWDSVRVLTRLLSQIKETSVPLKINFSDHTKVAKRRMLAITHCKDATIRKRLYEDLLKVTHRVVNYAKNAVSMIECSACVSLFPLVDEMKCFIPLVEQVVHQTKRRVLDGQSVPAEDKIVSLFEPHTDIIKKDRRDTFYGHKVCVSVGPSNLITDCLITKGNPADSTLMEQMLNRHDQVYGRYPLKVALDGGFASKKNLRWAKSKNIKDVCFAKKRGIRVEHMCRSEYVYNRLRRFRAGIESAISWLKRCFGLDRCTWKSLTSFHGYVWASVVSANLLTMARRANATT
jgi:IS5 family transposase